MDFESESEQERVRKLDKLRKLCQSILRNHLLLLVISFILILSAISIFVLVAISYSPSQYLARLTLCFNPKQKGKIGQYDDRSMLRILNRQSVRLDFAKPVNASEVRIAFDTDLTPMRVKERMPRRLVKVYRIEGLVNGAWKTLVEEGENFLRHRVHRFRETEITALRVTVTATWGDPSARIFEVRVY